MMQAFVDESAEVNMLFVMAGYVAPAESWALLRDEWQLLLDLNEHPHKPIKRFKMQRLRHLRGLHRAEMFYRVIERHVTAAFSCAIDTVEMRQAIEEFAWPAWVNPSGLENPYFFCFKAITEGLHIAQAHLKIQGPVNFIFDENTSKVACLSEWEILRENTANDIRPLYGDLPAFKTDEESIPLQAADLYAYWVRKWESAKDEVGVQDLRFPWQPLVDIPRFHRKFLKDDFLTEFARCVTAIESGMVDKSPVIPKINFEVTYVRKTLPEVEADRMPKAQRPIGVCAGTA